MEMFLPWAGEQRANCRARRWGKGLRYSANGLWKIATVLLCVEKSPGLDDPGDMSGNGQSPRGGCV
jgi:hypothetical protein